MGRPVTTDEKLDKLIEQGTDTRLAIATLTGEVRSVTVRTDGHDVSRLDFEQRIRQLERRMYGLPTLSALLGVAGLAVAVWSKVG